MLAPQRISEVVTYILEHFDQKTKRNNGFYTFNKLTNIADVAKSQLIDEKKQSMRLNGFNSIFAVSSIGIITFTLSSIGVKIGNVFGTKYKSKAEFAGGLILILLGTKILLEHLGIINF